METEDQIITEAETVLEQSKFKPTADTTKELSVKEMMAKMLEMQQDIVAQPVKPTQEVKKKPTFQFPKLWTKKIEDNAQKKDVVVVLYFNMKGYIEPPFEAKIQSGNMVVIRNKVYEIDPRSFWLIPIKKQIYKVVCIKEIDRRPISNLDLDEIKQRNDSTSSDEFLIKAALAQQQGDKVKKPVPMWLIIVLGLVILGALGFFLLNPSTATDAAKAATAVAP